MKRTVLMAILFSFLMIIGCGDRQDGTQLIDPSPEMVTCCDCLTANECIMGITSDECTEFFIEKQMLGVAQDCYNQHCQVPCRKFQDYIR